MSPIPFQGLIAPKGVRIINRAFPRLGLDMPHEFLGTDRLHDFGVDQVFPLQQPKGDAFARGRSSSFASKVGFVQFDLAFEFSPFQHTQMEQGFLQVLGHPRDDFHIHAQVLRQSVGGLQPIEPLQDSNLPMQATQAFALSTQLAFHIPATGVKNRKGPTKHTLATSQKVGRTTKNRASSSAHASCPAHHGYETP